jgi:hypothetical protein
LFLSLGLGYGLPSGDYNPILADDPENLKAKEADVADSFWRFIYVFPVFLNCIMLFNFLLFIKEEPIMYNLSKEEDAKALILIKKVYHADEDHGAVLRLLKKQVQKKQTNGNS